MFIFIMARPRQEESQMKRYSVKSGEVDVVIMAYTAWMAAKEAFEFAAGKTMDHWVVVREIMVEDGEVTHSAQALRFKWAHVAEAAGWIVE